MPRDSDGDKPKKSWREIDQSREKGGSGAPRSDPGAERRQSSQAYRSYKTQLNKLFDGGALPEALNQTLGDTSVASGAKEKKAAIQAILTAVGPKDTKAAVQRYQTAHGFPEDEGVLAKLLDLSDEAVVLQAIEKLTAMQAEGLLKRGASLKARLKTAEMTIDDPEVQRAARALWPKL